jgi:hypothetical protein
MEALASKNRAPRATGKSFITDQLSPSLPQRKKRAGRVPLEINGCMLRVPGTP